MGWSEIRRWMSQPLGFTTPSPSSSGDCDLAQRCAILLRPQIANAVESVDLHRLFAMLSKEMAMISGGSLSTSTSQAYGNIDIGEDVQWSVDVAPLLIDRCAVSNERYQKFVDDCGYDTDTWWSEAALPLRSKWVDRSGARAPQDWCHGSPPIDKLQHPVVGICWYEAEAYAKWVGKRLPSEAEWMWAAMASQTAGARYTWGAEWRNDYANTWHAGYGCTVPVSEFAPHNGSNKTCQFIGNVWEWTQTPFGSWSVDDEWGDCREFRAIKGGAFDTLLTNQVTIHFQSGEPILGRRHNVGFRCALNPTDLVGPK